MYDFEIAERFYELAALLKELQGSPYRARAFFRAALALDAYGDDIESAWQRNSLVPFRHVGKGVLARVDELLRTGRITELDELRLAAQSEPQGSDHPNAPTRQLALFGTEVPEHAACGTGVAFSQYAHAEAIARDIAACLAAVPSVHAVELVGAVKREEETIDAIEFLVAGGDASEIEGALKSNRFVAHMEPEGSDDLRAAIRNGCSLTVRCCARHELPTRALLLNSPKDYQEWLKSVARRHALVLDSSGLYRADGSVVEVTSEEEIFQHLAIPYVPPPLRRAFLPRFAKGTADARGVLDATTVIGDLHVHTEWSDGLDPLEAIVAGGERLGHRYVLVADHTAHLRLAKGLDIQRSTAQWSEIDRVNQRQASCSLLRGIEVDILPDGSLDFPPSFLKSFDVVIGAVHSAMQMSGNEMLARLEKALSTRAIDVLAHPTGRLLGRPGAPLATRAGYLEGIEGLCSLCSEHGVALEINCFPERMDLCADHAAKALENGLRVSIGTDAHSVRHLSLIRHGISIARRAWAPGEAVLNTLAPEELKAWAHERRSGPRERAKARARKSRALRLTPRAKPHNLDHLRSVSGHGLVAGVTAVGIDLSGSTKGRTGWASLKGSTVRLERVSTDEEIISATLSANPSVVSIDSPLRLPHGRCCADPLCKCSRFGIMREAERLLMRMGIGVFPCLLPSMVTLTTRGIRIASALREHGLTVIESFPGAAQDMLGIYRKKAGLSLLEKGLRAFGLQLVTDAFTHDDLDAATSALVGYYWLADQYLALGDEDESPIVVPRVPRYTEPPGRCVGIGVSGLTAAGKTTVGMYLAFKYGFRYTRYSLLLKGILNGRGTTPCTKQALQELGLELHQTIGPERLTEMLLASMSRDEHWVVDGLRHVGDVDALREAYGADFLHIHIHAAPRVRASRFSAAITKACGLFGEIDAHPVEGEVARLGTLAPARVENGGSFKSLFRRVDTLMEQLQAPW